MGARPARRLKSMTAERTESETRQPPGGGRWRWIQFAVLVGLIVSIRAFVFDLQATPGLSMYPTLQSTDVVLVEKVGPKLGWIHEGDVVVLSDPAWADRFEAVVGEEEEAPRIVKRVVATEGQTVEAIDGELIVDGSVVDEPYVGRGVSMRDFGPITVSSGHVFLLGDKRNYSTDSRVFGEIPVEAIEGRAILRIWPASRFGSL